MHTEFRHMQSRRNGHVVDNLPLFGHKGDEPATTVPSWGRQQCVVTNVRGWVQVGKSRLLKCDHIKLELLEAIGEVCKLAGRMAQAGVVTALVVLCGACVERCDAKRLKKVALLSCQ
eukprot:5201433-Amphidinium_carterae.2